MKRYMIEESDLLALEQLSKRLHTEDRMDADTMRDYGHMLANIAKRAKDVEIP